MTVAGYRQPIDEAPLRYAGEGFHTLLTQGASGRLRYHRSHRFVPPKRSTSPQLRSTAASDNDGAGLRRMRAQVRAGGHVTLLSYWGPDHMSAKVVNRIPPEHMRFLIAWVDAFIIVNVAY